MPIVFEHLVRLGFEAARLLPDVSQPANALRHGGHSFMLSVASTLPRENTDGSRCGDGIAQLRTHVDEVVRELDYVLLNERLTEPDDTSLLIWLREHLQLDPDATLSLRSAPRQGAIHDADGMHVWRRFRFEAAHRLPNVPDGHQCGRMHGHGFEITLRARLGEQEHGNLDAALRHAWEPVMARLDHHCLNDINGLNNPTSEVIAAWLWEMLIETLPTLSEISVQETDTAGCRYDGTTFRIWKDQRFESAVVFADGAAGDPRRQLHGHSYRLRLGLSAELDEVYGWTVDFGDVKTLFTPIYKRLDHHQLNELPGVESGDLCALLNWLHREAAPVLAQLDSIEIMETPEIGARVSW